MTATIDAFGLADEIVIYVEDDTFQLAKVKQIDSYAGCMIAVTEDNELWVWGYSICPIPCKIMNGVRSATIDSLYNYLNCLNLYIVNVEGKVEQYTYYFESNELEKRSNSILAGLTNIVRIDGSSGSMYYATDEDGVVYAWGGNNSYGQLGIGTSGNCNTPTEVLIVDSVKEIVFNHYCTLFLTENGDVYLAGGQTTLYSEPQKILSNVKKIRGYLDCGFSNLIAETADGLKYAVDSSGSCSTISYKNGFDIYNGCLYNDDKLISGPSDIETMWRVYGDDQVFVLCSDGTLWGMGKNDKWQLTCLADTTENDKLVPIYFGLSSDESEIPTPDVQFDALTGAVIVTYDNAMMKSSDYSNIKLTDADGKSADVTATLENNVLSLTATLTAGEYTLTVPAGTVKNQYGNLNEALTYTFTVSDPTPIEEPVYVPLTVENISLTDGRTLVALSGSFRFTANKECLADAEKIHLTDADGNAVALTVTVNGSVVTVSYAGLAEGTQYTLTADEGFLYDAENALSSAWSAGFTTVQSSERFFWTQEYFDACMEANYKNCNLLFYHNVILNSFKADSVSSWLRITGEDTTTLTRYGLAGNYWGTVNEELIGKQIIDFDDYQSLADLLETPYLTEAPEDVWPFVTDAYLLNADGERVDTVGNETVTFVVEFNRDMDTASKLRVKFGSSKPYAEYEISGEWVTARRWEGTYTLKTTIENGNQYFNISGASASGDPFLKLYEHAGRFRFEIDTTSAKSMTMQGNATETGVQLEWQQDDFDTLFGYNVYRSTSEDGFYQKLNTAVIPSDTKEFFDDTVEPGTVYYYNFTVVQSDMQESTPSGKITIMSMDTMAPNVYHSPVRTGYTNSNLIISATVTDNLAVSTVKLYYRTVGTVEWNVTVMQANNSKYSAVIGSECLTTAGIEYYIEATDGINKTCRGSAESPYSVNVRLAVAESAKGDVDGDGAITTKDALMLLQAANDLLNLSEEQFLRADLNGDGELSAVEALRILQYVSGKVSTIVTE